MRPFVLLASRSEDVAADDEYAAVLRLTGLRAGQLHRVRMESGAFTPLDLSRYSGVILGGSPFTVSTPHEYKSDTQRRVEAELDGVVADVLAEDVPLLGLCYGIGVVCQHTGGVVDGTYGEDTNAVTIELTADGLRDPLLRDMPPRFEAYVGHKEACTELPPQAALLATSPTCPAQLLRFGENVYLTQFHPEMDLTAITTRIDVYRHSGYFDITEIDEVLARVSAADVSVSHRVLRAFVERYARD